LHDNKICVIGNGVVLDPEELITEIDLLEKLGINLANRLFISNHCHIVMPYHKLLDTYKEARLNKDKIGTTGRGIGPSYSDKVYRNGVRLLDLWDDGFAEQLKLILEEKNFILKNFYKAPVLDYKKVYDDYIKYREVLAPFQLNTSYLLNRALDNNESVLCEGAQGTLLDIDFGTYPYVTSSSSSAGGACIGTGIPPTKIDKVFGVMKAYNTRVGEGFFPTELHNSEGKALQDYGKEFGATTGRPRRCGWFDAVLGKYSVMINGYSEIFMTKLDVLSNFDKVKVCTGYELDGKVYDEVILSKGLLDNAKPIYKELDGWKCDISHIRAYSALPDNAKQYVELVKDLLGTNISYISVGAEREATIKC
jgi:adenylosuccinate synthase